MKKKIIAGIMALTIMVSLAGCTNKEYEAAVAAITAYNSEVDVYNGKVETYNSVIDTIEKENASLTDAVKDAQAVIDSGAIPYDESTLSNLKDALASATDSEIEIPEKLPAEEKMEEVSDDLKKEELGIIAAKAGLKLDDLKAISIPDTPSVPDYDDIINNLETAVSEFNDSVSVMEQISAPSDDVVMKKLEKVETIEKMGAVTEDHDPNGKLGKQGGYIGCIFFRDSQVDQGKLSISGDREDPIDVGTQGGGAIEIFGNVDEAEARNAYLANFDGTILESGSHYVFGTMVIRTSAELTASQQTELTDKIKEAFLSVD